MILDGADLAPLTEFDAEICVIGAGPVGIVTALDLARRGRRVLLLESGGRRSAPATAALSEAENLRPDNHFDPHSVVARRLGGASNLWGGRCLPFDPIDYQARPWLGLGAWPITKGDLAPFEAAAVAGLAAGAAVWDEPLPGVAADPAFGFTSLERWSNVPRMQKLHGRALETAPRLLVALNTTVLGFDYAAGDPGRIAALRLDLAGQGREALPVRHVILAAGGNESVRLLLAEQRQRPGLFGGENGPLGRFYMGHLTGAVADIVFTDATFHDGMDFHVDAHGCYVRRRIVPSEATQEGAGIANIGFWPVVPRLSDPAHRSGPLSAAHLALSIGPLGRRLISEPIRVKHVGLPPYRRAAHLGNVARELARTMGFVPWFLWHSKVAKRRLPGFFLRNPARRYGLEYHSEQRPDPTSRVMLGEARDALGMPRLRIDLRFSEADATSVLKAHDALGAWLARNGLARIEHHHDDPEARAAAVLEGARDGTHQVGTLRMGEDASTAVVDRDCRSFDLGNLHVVSTGVLPTSGQANPTLTAVQLGLRLAETFAPT